MTDAGSRGCETSSGWSSSADPPLDSSSSSSSSLSLPAAGDGIRRRGGAAAADELAELELAIEEPAWAGPGGAAAMMIAALSSAVGAGANSDSTSFRNDSIVWPDANSYRPSFTTILLHLKNSIMHHADRYQQRTVALIV